MGVIWLLKALADISAFYLFTGPLAVYFGSSGVFWYALIQGFAYALARELPKKWLLPLPAALLAGCYALCWGNLYDLIAITPATGYLLWQVFRKASVPEFDAQQEILEGLWKPLGLAAVAAVLAGTLTALIPFALLIFGTNVALLRTLRHNPEVYLRPEFQLTNLGILAAVPLVSFLVGTGPVANFVGNGLKWLYLHIILPVFQGLLYYPMLWIDHFFTYLGTIFHPEEKIQETTEPLGKLEGAPTLPAVDAQQISETGQTLQIILIVLLAISAVIGMILLMRRLSKSVEMPADVTASQQQRAFLPKTGKRAVTEDSPTVQAVRKQYRRYLKLCIQSGVSLSQSSTSADICQGAQARKNLQPQANRVRHIYIRARYAGLATKEDAREMAALCTESKKES